MGILLCSAINLNRKHFTQKHHPLLPFFLPCWLFVFADHKSNYISSCNLTITVAIGPLLLLLHCLSVFVYFYLLHIKVHLLLLHTCPEMKNAGWSFMNTLHTRCHSSFIMYLYEYRKRPNEAEKEQSGGEEEEEEEYSHV